MAGHMGANECGMSLDVWPGSAACRAFVVDTPWSATFVSFVYMRAGVPGFAPSASHFDFVRQALKGGPDSPLRFADPDKEAPAVGDLLCFTRGQSAPMGPAGMRAYAERSGDSIAMHCDIVVSIDNGKLYAVGGNVLQGVTMRTLHVNRTGALWNLPHRGAMGVACTPGASAGVHVQSPGLGGAAETRTEGERTTADAGLADPVLHAVPVADAGEHAALPGRTKTDHADGARRDALIRPPASRASAAAWCARPSAARARCCSGCTKTSSRAAAWFRRRRWPPPVRR